MPYWTRPAGAAGWAVAILGALIALIGVVLTIGGAWLVALGGSFYYLVAGLALLASGALLIARDIRGAWLYAAVFVLTLIWSLWEGGLNGWALVPRLAGPLVLLVLVLAALPVLRPAGGRRLAIGGLAGLAVLVVLSGFVIAAANRPVIEASAVPAAGAASVSDPSPMQAGADWPAYGGTYSAQRFSPLDQITPGNVAQLEQAWVFRTGEIPNKFGPETTPLKIGDTLYGCTGMSKIYALDPVSGEQLWLFDPQVSDDYIPYTAACRGVSYYAVPGAAPADACAARVIAGTLDGRIVAVDARTGARCAGFGGNGEADIKLGMGEVIPGMVSITSPPVIVRGVIVTGHQVLDGQYRWAPSGVIKGFDAVTGQLRFAWDMMRPDIATLPPPGETYTPGTPNMWTTATGDEALGLVFLPMGNSAADYYSSTRRPLENAYATSLVALDVATGRPRWRFQTVHMDVWDYDLGAQATLADLPGPGGVTPALILPSKQGDIYVLDRRTGAPLTGVEERPAPQGGVEPEQRSATQPHSLFHTLRKPDLTERDMWGMSPIDQMICRINFRRAAYDGFYTPPTADRRWIEYPGYNGGTDWGGISLDPRRGVIVANYNDMPNYNRLVPREEAEARGWFPRGDPRAQEQEQGEENAARGGNLSAEGAGDPQVGIPYAIDVNAGWRMPFTKLLCKQPPYGGIRAIELATGRTLWDRPLGTARKNGPSGIPSMLPLDIGTPNNGGLIVTAGGLAFIAAATDDLIRAIDIETGETLWSDTLPAGGQATPMTYEQDGRQYVVIMAGGHHFMETPAGDYLIAYALPETE
jgi:quinoprotein glucose dehydrogenase